VVATTLEVEVEVGRIAEVVVAVDRTVAEGTAGNRRI
jgi:hypothetical protein